MSRKAKTVVSPYFKIGNISPRLYSAFLEPIGNMVNGSMYNPKHPTADEQGFRRDWIDALRKTDLPAVRLPGGNFVSGWDWKDSIGPMEQRKAHLDLAWHQYIPNDVGHDEYLQWAEKVGVEPLYTINLGTGDINDAISIIEYTNHEGGTYWSDLRAKYGHKDPYGVKLWYLGNEMDGYWQIASWEKNPTGYGVLANEVSKAMKWVDGSIETAVCVSCSPNMKGYPDWDRKVLTECYNSVDMISMHHYQSIKSGDYAAFLGASRYFEDYINTEIALSDFLQAKMRSPKKMMLSLDEYGVMMREPQELHFGRDAYRDYKAHYSFSPDTKFARHDPDAMGNMHFRRRGGHVMLPVLGNASVIMAMIRHADRVKVGCMTGGLGTMASCDHDHVWRSAAYYSYAQLMRYGRGVALQTSNVCDTYDIPSFAVDDTNQYCEQEGVEFVDSAAAFDDVNGELNVFVINRSTEDDMDYELDCAGFEGYGFLEHIEMFSDDPMAEDTYESPDEVVPKVNDTTVCDGGKVNASLHPMSWNIFRFVKK